eukprot:3579025-Pyramimonas_sp.AAC.1
MDVEDVNALGAEDYKEAPVVPAEADTSAGSEGADEDPPELPNSGSEQEYSADAIIPSDKEKSGIDDDAPRRKPDYANS